MSVIDLKRRDMLDVAAVRDRLRKEPDLSWLFFELTERCNLHCAHCGSSCAGDGLDLDFVLIRKTLKGIDPDRVMVALTGGEPMLHPRFYDIAGLISGAGFTWGMTTNATLIDSVAAKRLKETGMATVSVSIDGLEPAHDRLRGRKGAWRKAMDGVRALQNAGFAPQITTVVYRDNLDELDQLHELLLREGISSWRLINVEPIGRAAGNKDLLLSRSGFVTLVRKVWELHLSSSMDVSFGCSHFLGLESERMVRDQYFFCGAGLTIAGIRANGDICACLDIENRPDLVQGNVHTDDFLTVWENGFSVFRKDRTALSGKCSVCPDRVICGGDSTHTWDFDLNVPRICGKEYMEED